MCLNNKYLHNFVFTWQRIHSRSEAADTVYNIMPQWDGLIDAVFSTLLLHTPHPYHLSSTAQQQVWLSSQTIRTVHITIHDRHKLSRSHCLTAYSYVPAVLPGCQLRYQEKLQICTIIIQRQSINVNIPILFCQFYMNVA